MQRRVRKPLRHWRFMQQDGELFPDKSRRGDAECPENFVQNPASKSQKGTGIFVHTPTGSGDADKRGGQCRDEASCLRTRRRQRARAGGEEATVPIHGGALDGNTGSRSQARSRHRL